GARRPACHAHETAATADKRRTILDDADLQERRTSRRIRSHLQRGRLRTRVMKRKQMYGLIGIAGVGTAIMLSVGTLLGSSDTKPLVAVASVPVFLEAGDYERKIKRANLSVRRKKSEQTIELLLEPGDTLLGALVRAGVSGSEARAASDSLKSMIDLR